MPLIIPNISIAKEFNPGAFKNLLQSNDLYANNFLRKASGELCKDSLFDSLQNSYKNGFLFTCKDHDEIIFTAALNRSDWDSHHFGFESYFLNNIYFSNLICDADLISIWKGLLDLIMEKAKELKATFVSTDIPSQNYAVAKGLQNTGFKYVLTWLDGFYRSKILPGIELPESHSIGPATELEIATYATLAKQQYYTGGRFFLDHNFDITKVKEMYAGLVSSSFANGDVMLSYRIKNKPVALFICKKIYTASNGRKIAPLRFLIVDPVLRNKGIGRQLFEYTLNYLAEYADYITTGLEIHNLASLNLHAKLDFRFSYSHNVFHWWNQDT